MTEEKTLLVGLDLCEDYSQISCFNPVIYEPKSISLQEGLEKYLIPTALFYKSDSSEWFFGEEAMEMHTTQKGILIKNILQCASKKEPVEVDGNKIEPVQILERYLKRILGLLRIEYPNKTIRKLVVTIKEKNLTLINHIYEALQNLGISKVRACVQNHEECFISYAMHQPKELRMNDVILFDFDAQGLKTYQISINRRKVPQSVMLKKRDFVETLSYELLQEDSSKENVAYIFENISANVLHKQLVSTIFVTGKGFEGKWCREVLKELCVGRRVFIGQNLYAKGAVYAARELVGEGNANDYLYLGEETVFVNIFMPLYTESQFVEYPIIYAGTAWYNATKIISFIPDGESELELIFENVLEHRTEKHFISLEGLHQLARKSRIEMTIKFVDVNTCLVTLKDKGFGKLFPSSNRIWEKIIKLGKKI